MKLAVTIWCDNAAFNDDPGTELGWILSKLAEGLASSVIVPTQGDMLLDVNGNTCGRWDIS